MKKWVIVEDRPWVMEGLILSLEQKAEELGEIFLKPKVLYFIPGDSREERNAKKEKYRRNMEVFCDNIEVEPIEVTKDDFQVKMDRCVEEDDVILMDLNLNGSESVYFHSRQNVQYVKHKISCGEQMQIWFYTTGASLDSKFLVEEFSENCISVEGFEDGKVIMNTDEIWGYLENGEENQN